MLPIGSIRRYLPQVIAVVAADLMILNLGQSSSFQSIVIPSLVGISTKINPDETVHITADQSSWLSSCTFIAHPLGSLLSIIICDKFGRQKSLLALTIPIAIAWIVLGLAQSFSVICAALTVMGFCMGLKEAPSLTYIGEITEPCIRGTMFAIAVILHQLGCFLVFTFGATMPWRTVAFVCAVPPLVSFATVIFIPESPAFLLSQNRLDEARKALQWLRGWTTPQSVHKELTELQKYCDESTACDACAREETKCSHPKLTFYDKIKALKQKRTLKPLFVVLMLYLFVVLCTMSVIGPYIVQVLKAFGSPLDVNMVTVYISGVGILAGIFLILTIKKMGRRPLYFASNTIVVLCSFGLGIYGFIFFPLGWTSFDNHSSDEYIHGLVGSFGYVPLVLIVVLQFSAKFGVFSLPSTIISEAFPFKSRSFLCGIAMASFYCFGSIVAKTYYNVETLLSLPGAMVFYGVISLIGAIVVYNILPETEGRTLEDIELHYSDDTKKITDIHIRKNARLDN